MNFDGIGNGVAGFTVHSAPPDTNMAVGPNHLVQMVNSAFAVYSKSGSLLNGPAAINTLWQNFGGLCQADDDGDPVVRYDALADRYVISQFAVRTTTSYLECVAISQTPDPTGSYYRYAFSYGNFNDYPKIGIWPDAYYATYNQFGGANNFIGSQVCALDRAKMLTGATATQQCFSVGINTNGLLAADLTGTRLPPAGAPNHVIGMGALDGTLGYWNFHVDFVTPANSTLTGPTILNRLLTFCLAATPATPACSNWGLRKPSTPWETG